MKARVYYWKDPKYLMTGMGVPGFLVPKPTREDIERDFELFWQGEVADDTTPEDIFVKFNALPVPVRLPPGIKHTSMSVGDVVSLGAHFYVCMPVGWEKV